MAVSLLRNGTGLSILALGATEIHTKECETKRVRVIPSSHLFLTSSITQSINNQVLMILFLIISQKIPSFPSLALSFSQTPKPMCPTGYSDHRDPRGHPGDLNHLTVPFPECQG